ncbi:MAG: TIGR03067 domain-containing protein [Gemmataceae bacterium]
MKWFLALVLGGVLVNGVCAEDAAKKDLNALQGRWVVQVLHFNGNDVSNKYKFALVFKDNVATLEGNDAVKKEYAKIAFQLDPSTTPPCLDLKIVGGAQQDAVIEGIYELKGDSLRICVNVFGNERPGEFKSPAGGSIALVTLKRE